MTPNREWRDLVAYNLNVLRQAAGLIGRCTAAGLVFADLVGPHLRHIVEHYEAFVVAVAVRRVPGSGAVHYDARPRDARFERDARFALQRIAALQVALVALDRRSLPDAVDIHLLGGPHGEREFVSASSPERELMFLASHATHHFALVKARLEQQGVAMHERFGQAPATVRHAAAHAS
jgi:hypothetical protein